MKITPIIKNIIANYAGENPGVKASLVRMLMHGKLAGTGKLVILPVDQGMEHGPARSFAVNPSAYDPKYHFQLAIDSGLNAYAAPLGMLSAAVDEFAGHMPLILKMNSSNSLSKQEPDQAIMASVKDALRLGCCAIGLTIYPGSNKQLEMLEEARDIINEAKSYGLATVVWSYPRGAGISKQGETAIDIVTYGCYIAATLGADIIKVKLPTDYIEQSEAKKIYTLQKIPLTTIADRVRHVRQAAFSGRRIVIFSGGATKDESELYEEIKQIMAGGGDGSIIGRNAFQRPYKQAVDLLAKVIKIYSQSL
jgi:class I fructose-bisphosphate aldolase